jgi:omega-6 fatty acid desaturase (delta-12 desaturase)
MTGGRSASCNYFLDFAAWLGVGVRRIVSTRYLKVTLTLTQTISAADAKPNWNRRLSAYAAADNGRAIFEICVTILPFIALWAGMWGMLDVSYWLVILLAIPAAGLMVRLFIIQHDCGHGAMLTSRKANDWIGRLLGILTLTPYDYWRHTHALHHASSGNLDRRGIGDIDTITVAEYRALGSFDRLKYRLYRHPLVMFGLGPAYLFILQHRLPVGAMHSGAVPWVSTMLTNIGIAVIYGILIWAVGFKAFLMIQVPLVLMGASIGVWLFYVQHQFDPAHWDKAEEWNREEAALYGSSFYDLPKPLMWMTGNIGIHHVHHLASRIPFHQLPQILKDYPELRQIGRISLRDSLGCIRLTLWDETCRKLVSFRDFYRMEQAA